MLFVLIENTIKGHWGFISARQVINEEWNLAVCVSSNLKVSPRINCLNLVIFWPLWQGFDKWQRDRIHIYCPASDSKWSEFIRLTMHIHTLHFEIIVFQPTSDSRGNCWLSKGILRWHVLLWLQEACLFGFAAIKWKQQETTSQSSVGNSWKKWRNASRKQTESCE